MLGQSACATAGRWLLGANRPGIGADMLGRLFQPFVATKAQGLGLVHSICYSIVMAHGGRLWADNNPERRATFIVALPAAGG